MKLALQGGTPVRREPWPPWPVFDTEEERAVLAALHAGDWGGFPMPNTWAARFADDFARRHDCRFGQCVSNGTVSLEIAIQALGVEPGAEVVVPAYTFEATAAAMLFAGAVPVFADVEADSYCLDPEAVESLITDRTQAIVAVHLGRHVADMDRLTAIADRRGLRLLEDCAHAHGARWRRRAVGSLGDAGSFSFQTTKLMTAGEGGIVVTDDEAVLDALYALANCGRQRPGRRRDVGVIGHNYRMTDLQAAILEVQLRRLDEQHERRNRNLEILDAELPLITGISTLRRDPRITTQAAYQYVFRYAPEAFDGLSRSAFVAALRAEGIPCDGQFYEALPSSELLPPDGRRYPDWSRRRQAECPRAHRAAYVEAIWLPHHLFLGTTGDVSDVLEAIVKVASLAKELRGYEHPAIAEQNEGRTRRS